MKLLRGILTGLVCLTIVSSCTGKSIKDIPFLGEYFSDRPAAERGTEENKLSQTSAEPELDEDDKLLISRLIACEVGDRPYKAQVCLASVILNRIADESFSDNARGVVFESGDFVSVAKGLVSGVITDEVKNSPQFKVARQALEDALQNGDPTGGALYFGYISGNSPSVSGTFECGGMVFGR